MMSGFGQTRALVRFLYLRVLGAPDAAVPHLGPAADPDWDQLVAIADRNALLAALAFAVTNTADEANLPPGLGDFLARLLQLASERAEKQQALTLRLNRDLRDGGFLPVFLKGSAHQLSGLYPEPGWRFAHDIDVLVAPDHARAAWQHLVDRGYRRFFETETDAQNRTYELVRHHLGVLVDPETNTPVEVHHRILRPELKPDRLLPQALERAEPASKDGCPPVLQLSLVDRMVHLIAHAALQNGQFAEGVFAPRDLLEGALLADRASEAERETIAERFRAAGHARLHEAWTWHVEQVRTGEMSAYPSDRFWARRFALVRARPATRVAIRMGVMLPLSYWHRARRRMRILMAG